MNSQEKALARVLFQNKIYQADGNKFEDIFTAIQNYAEPGFQQIVPWGNIGDRKNDGYIESKGIYYQVYAPQDIKNNYPEVVKKLKGDFAGLKKQWPGIRAYYFVVNDKYKGVNADSEIAIKSIVSENGLDAGGFMTPKDLENILFQLSDDQIYIISGFLPDTNSITHLDYSAVTQVIGFIMTLPIAPSSTQLEFPDWEEKIKFNKLSPYTEHLLNTGAQKLGSLNNYLADQTFLAESLQEKLSGLYQVSKSKVWDQDEDQYPGDRIFWDLVKQCAPRNEAHFESAVITIVAKYFESCDVFEKNHEDIQDGIS